MSDNMTSKQAIEVLSKYLKGNPHLGDMPLCVKNLGEVEAVAFNGTYLVICPDWLPTEVDPKSRKEYFESMLNIAGFKILDCYELPNEYWPLSYFRLRMENPWWLFKTQFGLLKIGWRKRVIAIGWDWIDCVVTQDDVTKNSMMVHAWTDLKAVEYLKQLCDTSELNVLYP